MPADENNCNQEENKQDFRGSSRAKITAPHFNPLFFFVLYTSQHQPSFEINTRRLGLFLNEWKLRTSPIGTKYSWTEHCILNHLTIYFRRSAAIQFMPLVVRCRQIRVRKPCPALAFAAICFIHLARPKTRSTSLHPNSVPASL